MKKALFLLTVFASSIAIQSVQADLQSDIAALFSAIQASKNDSGITAADNILKRYKSPNIKQLLTARATINGITNSTPLHVAVQGNNPGICGQIFGKASFVGTRNDYLAFAAQIANTLDGNNRVPAFYTTNASIITLLNTFPPSTTPSTSSSGAPQTSSQTTQSGSTASQGTLDSDITNFFNYIKVVDSNNAKVIIRKYKNSLSDLEKLLSAEKTIDGISKTTPLHYAAKMNDYNTAIDMLVKASNVQSTFGSTLAKKIDGAGKKPIDYLQAGSPLMDVLKQLGAN